MDDFFTRALIAGVGVSLVAGPFGCFIVWRRLAYFGDTLSHAALLGVVIAFWLDFNIVITVFCISSCISIALLLLQKRATLSSDTLLGLLAHSTLALGLVVLAFMTWVRIDLLALLFGDILSVSQMDILIIWLGGPLLLIVLAFIWRSLFALTVNYELAEAEGVHPDVVNIIFLLLISVVIAISIKIVGVLLITAMLIIPAATARKFSTGPEQMAVLASLIGASSVIGGLFSSLKWDTPSGPTIVVIMLLIFLISVTPLADFLRKRRDGKLTVPKN